MMQSIVHIALVVKDYIDIVSKKIEIVHEPKEQSYGIVEVFKDSYGNLSDLVRFKEDHPIYKRVISVI